MKLGITGIRHTTEDILEAQFNKILNALRTITNEELELHHGDCTGADLICHNVAAYNNMKTVSHPPKQSKFRLYIPSDETREPYDYIKRNENMVNEIDVLIAFPPCDKEMVRSGAWTTVRYATKTNKKIIIVLPNGSVNVNFDIDIKMK